MNYRPNVCIIVVNGEGLILAGERSDLAGAWQFPQGGIEAGEELFEAALRELEEEIGTSEVDILGALPGSIRYDWPEERWRDGWRGQEQRYVLAQIRDSAKLDPNCGDIPEFRGFRWVTQSEFSLLTGSFKRDAYVMALSELAQLFPGKIKL